MTKKKKGFLAAVLLYTVTSGFTVTAYAQQAAQEEQAPKESLARHYLSETLVEAQRSLLAGGYAKSNSSVGILGEKQIMEVPFSLVNLSNKTIETFGGANQPLQSILANNPAVRIQGTTLHNDFSIRGIKGNGTSSYLNGIPGLMTQFAAPTFMIEDIQFISGPNSGITGLPSTYETSSAGGIVNFVAKKAGDQPLTRYRQTFSGKGSLGEYLDISRRFGKDNAWGVRINTEVLNGETAIDNNNMNAQGIFVNLDHRDAKSSSNLLFGYRHLDIKGGARWFSLKSSEIGKAISKVPNAPDASNDYGFDGLEKESEGYIMAFNHEQKMNTVWKWFLNAGLNHNKLQKNIIGASSNFMIINDQGDVSNNLMSTQTVTRNYYAQLGLNGKFNTGVVGHDLTLAIDKAWHSIAGAKNMYNNGSMGSVGGNIYTGIYGNNVIFPSIQTGLSSKDQYLGLSIADTIKYKKMQLLVGVHKHSASVNSYNKITEQVTQSVDSDAICPTYGIVYQPTEHISLYASHAENFDKGTIVDSKYVNAGAILNPAKTKQNELGVKYQNAGYLVSLGIFDIQQANNIDVQTDKGLYLSQDGEQTYKGVELSINGKLAPKWNFMGGLMYLKAKQNKTQGGTNDGLTVNGVANWNAVAALEYNPDDKFSLIGRVLYTGKAPIFNEKLEAPAYVTLDLGVNYKTKINDTPVTLSAMCYNVTDKNYWTAYGNNLILSTPRTFMLSANFNF